jgi:transcriptional regulator with XRE-family HTH domain
MNQVYNTQCLIATKNIHLVFTLFVNQEIIPIMTTNLIYERIKEQADNQHLSLRQLSIKSGFKSPSAISRYKQGVTPTDTAVNAIAGALGVSVDYLLGKTDDMHANKKATSNNPVDLKEVAENDNWDDYLSADGRPLSDHDKNLLRVIFGD